MATLSRCFNRRFVSQNLLFLLGYFLFRLFLSCLLLGLLLDNFLLRYLLFSLLLSWLTLGSFLFRLLLRYFFLSSFFLACLLFSNFLLSFLLGHRTSSIIRPWRESPVWLYVKALMTHSPFKIKSHIVIRMI